MKKQKFLGIEFGSTRIKSVLIDEGANVLAQGSHEWKSTLKDGLWSYSMEEVEQGLQASFADLKKAYQTSFGAPLTEVSAIGVSAMMHGYLAFDRDGNLLVPFRTWQNTNTAQAAEELSALFSFNIPQRWSVSHFYQAVLNGEPHVSKVAHLNTLAGYVHERLTGKRVLGVGDASGMFPLDGSDYNGRMLALMQEKLQEKGVSVSFASLLPQILVAGEEAGKLTEEGAKWLDPTGTLAAGCVLCPPEGDAGTGMIATNSVRPRTANISAGTSGFLMAVLERDLSKPYPEIDVVATPMGAPVAMIHVNNFTSEINAWASLLREAVTLGGGSVKSGEWFDLLYHLAEQGDEDCGGLVGYNFRAGEPIAGVEKGVPLIMQRPEGKLTLANFMKMQLYSALGSLSMGMRLLHEEQIELDSVCGHGGFFKAGKVCMSAMSAAVGAPVTVLQNAGEGGAWGIAILALLTAVGEQNADDFLDRLFASSESVTVDADERELTAFQTFMAQYEAFLAVERLAATR